MVLFDALGALLKVFVIGVVAFVAWVIGALAVAAWRACKLVARVVVAVLGVCWRVVTIPFR